jgi:(+)-trans-carveol dehydrogenase
MTGAKGRFEGKVVFISGVARGQGRRHAVDFAREGADVIGFDILEDVPLAHVPMATEEELRETVAMVEDAGGRIVATKADARDFDQVTGALQAGLDAFGRVDVVVCNAGIAGDMVPFWQMSEAGWRHVVDTNLTGAWHTAKAATPAMIDAGEGGAIILTGSVLSAKGFPNVANYAAAKHGLVGLMRVMAIELGEHKIRVNMILPSNVDTRMFMNEVNMELFVPGSESPSIEEFESAARAMHLLPVGWVEPEDVSAAARWLASDEARYVTGHMLPVDAGLLAK